MTVLHGYNLEDEYGWILDGIEAYTLTNPEQLVVHSGVKGMRWGIRKDHPSNELRGLGPERIERTTKNGDKLVLTKTPPNALNKGLARLSSNYRESYKKGAFLDIRGKDGEKVGSASLWKKSDDELYLNWISIKNSARGNGYASAALKAAEGFGSQAGFKKMTLEVPGNAPDARHIYEKMGFKVVKEDIDPTDTVWGGLTQMEYKFNESAVQHSTSFVDDFFAHHGIKGMKWGVRRSDAQISAAPKSEDAARKGELRAKTKTKTGTSALSNREMQEVVTRLNLEQQYSRLTHKPSKGKLTQNQIKGLLAVGVTVNSVIAFTNSPAGKLLKDAMAPSGGAHVRGVPTAAQRAEANKLLPGKHRA